MTVDKNRALFFLRAAEAGIEVNYQPGTPTPRRPYTLILAAPEGKVFRLTGEQLYFGLQDRVDGEAAPNWESALEVLDELLGHCLVPDASVQDGGSVCILSVYSKAARAWCDENLPEDAPRWGARGYAIEARYVLPIVRGLQDAGLTVGGFDK